MTVQYKSVKEVGAFYNTAHLLRPIDAATVNRYGELMVCGVKFPPIQLGEYTGMDGTPSKIIIDGVHIYRAAIESKRKTIAYVLTKYPNLASAMAAQLKANINNGLALTSEQRDIRMRMLIEVYQWTQLQVADAVGLSVSSVSRILAGKQNLFKTGKRGRVAGKKKIPKQFVPTPLPPRQFLQAIKRIHLTLSTGKAKVVILAQLQDPLQRAELPKTMLLLQQVSAEVEQLIQLAVAASSTPVATELPVAV